jgi:carboxylesterase type B
VSKLLDGFPDLGTVRSSFDLPQFLRTKNSQNRATSQAHSSDLMNVFGGGVMTDYFIRFVNTLDPNGSPSPRAQAEWPRYDPERPQLLTFLPEYVKPSVVVTDDNFRKEPMDWFAEMAKRYRM